MLVNKISEDKARTSICIVEKSGELFTEALEDTFANIPAENDESEDKLKNETPDDMTPDDISRMFGEDETKEDQNKSSEQGDESSSVVSRVSDDKDSDDSEDDNRDNAARISISKDLVDDSLERLDDGSVDLLTKVSFYNKKIDKTNIDNDGNDDEEANIIAVVQSIFCCFLFFTCSLTF